jgi:hypothetical protein
MFNKLSAGKLKNKVDRPSEERCIEVSMQGVNKECYWKYAEYKFCVR